MENQNNNTNNLPVASPDVKLKIFNFEGAEVRAALKDGEPLFVAKDVCQYFGDTNYRRSVGRLDDDEKCLIIVTDRLGREQTATAVTESGLFHLLLNFQPEQARYDGGVSRIAPHNCDGVSRTVHPLIEERLNRLKRFKRWVTHEVLPSIRKTGGYLIARKDESPEEIMARALLVAKDTIDRLNNQIEQDRPKVQFADAVTASDTCITVGELAKLISQSTGYKTGRDRLFDFLRKAGWLISYGSSRNMPSQKGMERGFFVIHERTGQSGNGNPPVIFKTTKVTGKGQQYFLEYFNRENPL